MVWWHAAARRSPFGCRARRRWRRKRVTARVRSPTRRTRGAPGGVLRASPRATSPSRRAVARRSRPGIGRGRCRGPGVGPARSLPEPSATSANASRYRGRLTPPRHASRPGRGDRAGVPPDVRDGAAHSPRDACGRLQRGEPRVLDSFVAPTSGGGADGSQTFQAIREQVSSPRANSVVSGVLGFGRTLLGRGAGTVLVGFAIARGGRVRSTERACRLRRLGRKRPSAHRHT